LGEVRPDRPGDCERAMLSGQAIGNVVASRHGVGVNYRSAGSVTSSRGDDPA
jgi:hypothetical protein